MVLGRKLVGDPVDIPSRAIEFTLQADIGQFGVAKVAHNVAVVFALTGIFKICRKVAHQCTKGHTVGERVGCGVELSVSSNLMCHGDLLMPQGELNCLMGGQCHMQNKTGTSLFCIVGVQK